MQDLQERSLRTHRALIATIVLSFAFLLGSAAVMWAAADDAHEADQLVLRTLEIKEQVAQILTSMTAAESGLRGYLLAGDERLLAAYVTARKEVPDGVAALRGLVAASPPQVTRVDELSALIQRRLLAMDDALSARRQGRAEEAGAIVRDRAQPLMDEFRTQIAQLDRLQDDSIVRHQQDASTDRDRFFRTVQVMLLSCGVLALFALVSARRFVYGLEASRALLRDQNRLLEQRVHERTQELDEIAKVAMRERQRAESLLTDVNHRVGNNLALVSSFLSLQQRAVKHPEASRALDAARTRVQAIASAHRKLRLSEDFASVRANDVLAAVVEDIAAGLPHGELIKIECDVAALDINARDAVSLGVLTSELVMNAVKHAFVAGQSGWVGVRFAKPDRGVPFIEVADDGVGCPPAPRHEGESLGGKIIEMVARQFGSVPERTPLRSDSERPGTRIRIELGKLQLATPS